MNRSRHSLALSAGLAAWLALAGSATAVPSIGGSSDWTANPVYQVDGPLNGLDPGTYTWNVGSGESAVQNYGTAPDLSGLASGPYTLTATEVTPTAGETDSLPIKIDKLAPVINSPALSPAGGTYQFGTVVTFTGCNDEERSGVATCSGSVGGTPVGVGGPVPTNSLGPKSLVVSNSDNVGNVGGGIVAYTVIDTIPPSPGPVPLSPTGATPDTTPTFTWDPAKDLGGSGIDDYVLTIRNSGGTPVFTSGLINHTGNQTNSVIKQTFTLSSALPQGSYTWTVRAIENGGTQSPESAPLGFTVDLNAPASPVFTDGPTGMTNEARPRFAWTGATGATFSWALRLNGVLIASANTATPAVTVGPLADGAGYTFEVSQTTANGIQSQPAQRAFGLDTVAPPPTTLARKPRATSTVPTPTFGWLGGGEPGGAFRWRILNAKDEVVQGPTETTGSEVQVKPLAAGTYRFIVQAVDAAGNQSPGTDPFVFKITEPAAPKPNVNAATPATRNARLLAPKPATKLRVGQPRLSWTATCRGVVLYNVQLFRLNGRKLTKVHSAFPRTTSYRVPPNIVRAGVRYVWQLWCWRGPKLGYQATPLGITYFDQLTAPKPDRLLAPTRATHPIGTALVVRWRPAPRTSGYQVTLFRGNARVAVKTTRGVNVTFPGTLLGRDATYRVVIRRAVAPRRYSRSAWAGTTFRVPPAT